MKVGFHHGYEIHNGNL